MAQTATPCTLFPQGVLPYAATAILPRCHKEVDVADRLMSRREVAEFLDVPEASLARWAYAGGGPSYFRVGRHSRYRLEDVLAWLEAQRHRGERAVG